MWARIFTLALISLLMVSCNMLSSIEGAYVGSEDDGHMMVQIDSIKDGTVSGVISILGINDIDKLQTVRKEFSGRLDGNILTISSYNGTIPMTAELNGSTMTISFYDENGIRNFVLKKSDPSEFAKLNGQINEKISAKITEKQNIQTIQANTAAINDFTSLVQDKINGLSEKEASLLQVISDYESNSRRLPNLIKARGNINPDNYRFDALDSEIERIIENAAENHKNVVESKAIAHKYLEEFQGKALEFQPICEEEETLPCDKIAPIVENYSMLVRKFYNFYSREASTYERFKKSTGRVN